MRTKSKGKVHPSPSPPPPSSSSRGEDCLSVLKLLPAVILVLVSALSPEDKQVLAYLITRSLKTTTTTSTGRTSCDSRNKKSPVLDCECFDCYMSYWFRWDSSPNRELIHQIIEAFEDHLENNSNSSAASQISNGMREGVKKKKKKKDRSTSRRRVEESPIASEVTEPVLVVPSDEVKSPEKSTEMLRFPVAAATGHKGLARKVLPDVLGLFNSRFWRLWSPNP
ncbi:uncharacterized protein LOC108860963 [Raphanus sativus]|uniref:Uncharacterized protein LOC108860963 n=1 Tax=Raphanus sativus TaxID=3726 RepID=A0A6J0P1A7_RAPSA|nr:uncharacterized protein LOC108860963 [Raphanus sativus]